jgi:hypothetical protein
VVHEASQASTAVSPQIAARLRGRVVQTGAACSLLPALDG